MTQTRHARRKRVVPVFALAVLTAGVCFAGVSRPIQDRYRRNYENKALFLKLPIFSDKVYIFIVGRSVRPEPPPPEAAARLKVGDQVRVLALDFGGDEIKFKVSAIKGALPAEIVYKFDANLQDEFPNSEAFDAALAATFTEGLKYTDLEDAKRGFVVGQFENAVRDIATTTGSTREFVLKSMAAHLPAYQDALRDIDNLKSRNQELSSQLAQAQNDNRRLEAELKQQQAEVSRLKSVTTSLQEKIDSSSSQLSRLGEDLRSARGTTQNYQTQLTNLQRSLNLRVDESRDLPSQIAELGQAVKKLQRDNEQLGAQNSTLRSSLDSQQATNKRLSDEIEDLKNSTRQMSETINTLTSKEDSLARQYLELKQVKENLENITRAFSSLEIQTLEERSEGGMRSRKLSLSLHSIPLGTIEWRLPELLSHDAAGTGELRFSMESIDYVRATPEVRHLLRSLGERLKVGVKLASPTPLMEVQPENEGPVQEVGERDQAVWRWKIHNRGIQDTRLSLSIYLINKNTNEISVLRGEPLVLSSSMVRQVRNYLQPLPVAVGAVIGFLLFGIVGIFRRGQKRETYPKGRAVKPSEPTSYIGQKQL